MKLVQCMAVDGLAVTFGTAHPTASVPITVFLYNGPLLYGFNVPIKELRGPSEVAVESRRRADNRRAEPGRRTSNSSLDTELCHSSGTDQCRRRRPS